MLSHRHACYIVLLVLFGTLSGCGSSGPTVLKSTDGQFQITALSGMTKMTGLNDEADIQTANIFSELYAVVLTEPKSDFDPGFSLEEFNEVVIESLRAGIGGTWEPSKDSKTTAGAQAKETVVFATVDGSDVAYLILTVDTGQHFHQVLTWTLKNNFTKHRATLQKVAVSLKATRAQKPKQTH